MTLPRFLRSVLTLLAIAGVLTVSPASVAQTTSPTPTITVEINQLFDLAQKKLPDLFASGSISQIFENYVYRFYPATGVYIGIANNTVYLLGGQFGNALVNVGSISFVMSELNKFPDPTTTPGGGSSTDLWDLKISGTVTGPVAVGFNDLLVQDVVAPDLNNTDELNREIVRTMDGVATGISSIQITVVNNSANQRTFDVRFSATIQSFFTLTYNLRYDYTR